MVFSLGGTSFLRPKRNVRSFRSAVAAREDPIRSAAKEARARYASFMNQDRVRRCAYLRVREKREVGLKNVSPFVHCAVLL